MARSRWSARPGRSLTATGAILLVTLSLAGCTFLGLRGSGAPQVGLASWYGKEMGKRKTASGEKFDAEKLTAAHPSLPFGSRVLVTNLENGKSVEVRITDRGPFARGRVIDVSQRAARVLGFAGRGTARVRVEPLR